MGLIVVKRCEAGTRATMRLLLRVERLVILTENWVVLNRVLFSWYFLFLWCLLFIVGSLVLFLGVGEYNRNTEMEIKTRIFEQNY